MSPTGRIIAALLRVGADPHARHADGWTPLHHAVEDDAPNATAVRFLLAAGADPDARDDAGRTPLHAAADPTTRPREEQSIALAREARGHDEITLWDLMALELLPFAVEEDQRRPPVRALLDRHQSLSIRGEPDAHPSRGVAGGDGQDRFSRFERDVSDALRRRLNGVKRATLVPEFEQCTDGRSVGRAAQGGLVRLLQRRRSAGVGSALTCQTMAQQVRALQLAVAAAALVHGHAQAQQQQQQQARQQLAMLAAMPQKLSRQPWP